MNPLVYFLSFANNFQTKTLSVLRHKNSLLPFLMQNREQAERRGESLKQINTHKVLWIAPVFSLQSTVYTVQYFANFIRVTICPVR